MGAALEVVGADECMLLYYYYYYYYTHTHNIGSTHSGSRTFRRSFALRLALIPEVAAELDSAVMAAD